MYCNVWGYVVKLFWSLLMLKHHMYGCQKGVRLSLFLSSKSYIPQPHPVSLILFPIMFPIPLSFASNASLDSPTFIPFFHFIFFHAAPSTWNFYQATLLSLFRSLLKTHFWHVAYEKGGLKKPTNPHVMVLPRSAHTSEWDLLSCLSLSPPFVCLSSSHFW